MIMMIAINGALPVTAVIIGLYLEWSSGKEDEEEAEKEAMMRLTKEMEKKQEEEEAKEREEMMAMSTNGTAAPPVIQVQVTSGDGNEPMVGSGTGVPPNASFRPLEGSMMSPDGKLQHSVNDPMAWSVSMKPEGSFMPPVKLTEKEKKRRQLRALRMRNDARKKVQNDLEQEAIALNDAQADVDHHIDIFVKGKLQIFLMIGGLIGFVALAMCLLGIMARTEDSVGPVFPSVWTTETQLAGYDSWDDFTASCCCSNNTNTKSAYVTIEKWMCSNGRLKERVRATTTAEGFVVRELCDVSFASDCAVIVAPDKTVTMTCATTGTNQERALW